MADALARDGHRIGPPRWRQVAEVIGQRITDGTYAPGTRVPSVLALSAEFGIATSTSRKVHRGLRA